MPGTAQRILRVFWPADLCVQLADRHHQQSLYGVTVCTRDATASDFYNIAIIGASMDLPHHGSLSLPVLTQNPEQWSIHAHVVGCWHPQQPGTDASREVLCAMPDQGVRISAFSCQTLDTSASGSPRGQQVVLPLLDLATCSLPEQCSMIQVRYVITLIA